MLGRSSWLFSSLSTRDRDFVGFLSCVAGLSASLLGDLQDVCVSGAFALSGVQKIK